MLDRERILAKLDEIDGYLTELTDVLPSSFEEYKSSTAARRATERLLQLSVEAVFDTCSLFVSGLRLGLPSGQDDLVEKLMRAEILTPDVSARLRSMKGFRNLLVHEYGGIDDAIVFRIATTRLSDFASIKAELLDALEQD